MPEYSLGARPGPVKAQDKYIAQMVPVGATHPDSWQPKNMVKSQFQGDKPWCVDYAMGHGSECQEWKERGRFEKMARGYLYNNREPQHYQGDGMIPEEALWLRRHKGIPRAAIGTIKTAADITPEMIADALYQRLASYARVGSDDEVKTALTLNGDYPNPVHICIPVYDSFYNCPGNGMLALPDTSKETLHGYHEINIDYWIKDKQFDFRWAVQNWWWNWGDTQMADYAMAYMPPNYPIIEKWAAVDATIPAPELDRIISFRAGDFFITVDGVRVNMDVPVKVEQGRTWLALRFAAEGIGGYVKEWNDATASGTIIIPGRGR